MSQPNKTEPVPPEPSPDCERRRIGKVEVAPDGAAASKAEERFNPYANGLTGSGATATHHTAAGSTGNTARTDLRKLSEWIKLTRELEERKRNGGDRD